MRRLGRDVGSRRCADRRLRQSHGDRRGQRRHVHVRVGTVVGVVEADLTGGLEGAPSTGNRDPGHVAVLDDESGVRYVVGAQHVDLCRVELERTARGPVALADAVLVAEAARLEEVRDVVEQSGCRDAACCCPGQPGYQRRRTCRTSARQARARRGRATPGGAEDPDAAHEPVDLVAADLVPRPLGGEPQLVRRVSCT
jgi:hypothetical protein